ncbi:MAG: DUF6048 family protein [Bacteroidota bacterium]
MLSVQLFAQDDAEEVEEKEKKEYKFHGVRVGANLIRAGRTFLGSGVETQEIQVALGVNGVELNVDYGTERNEIMSDYQYVNEGSYLRFGIDRNFVKNPGSGNALSLGLRYATASFEDKLDFTVSDFDAPDTPQDLTFANSDLNSWWLELVFNLRGKIVSNLYTGFTLRWQFANTVNGQGVLKTFDIPGFGNTKRENSTAFDYYIMWRIPLKE